MPSSRGGESRSLTELLKSSPKTASATSTAPTIKRGSLASTSIFGDEEAAAPAEPATPGEIERTVTDQEYLTLVDPDRATSWSWPRRFEARMHRRRGRLTKTMKILQTERAHTVKSHWIKTSLKKLAPLARQISGMKLDDAIVQMRFSAKKPSTDIMNHLTTARLEAMVRRGMKPEEMYVAEAWVGRGTFERELNHRARGRIDMLRKPYTSMLP